VRPVRLMLHAVGYESSFGAIFVERHGRKAAVMPHTYSLGRGGRRGE